MQDIFKTIELADKSLTDNVNIDDEIINNLKQSFSSGGYIGIAQINTIPGNIEYNAKKIAKYVKFAEATGLDCIIFPELSLIGCSMEKVVQRHHIIVENNIKWLKGIAALTKNTTAFVGFISKDNSGKCYNSVAVLKAGIIQDVLCDSVNLYKNCIISIGSDDKNIKNFIENNNIKANLLINCSAISYKHYKYLIANNVFSDISLKYKMPVIFANQVGANDNIIYEGLSCAYNSQGELFARAKAFEEQILVINSDNNTGKIHKLPDGYKESIVQCDKFSLNYENDMERTYKALVQGIRDYFYKCGLKRAVLGLSGGLDSTVCAVLLADALGSENVYGVSMPSHITSSESKNDAEQLAHNLGINYVEAPIRSLIDTANESFSDFFNKIEKHWNDRYKQSFTPDNIQARSRAMILFGISNEFPNCIPIATSDKSEAYMGYATINGDMSGGYAPIADITKTKLFALARWLNSHRQEKNAIPESVIQKKPGAELAINPKTGKPLIAEDALMPYEFLDEVIWHIENENTSYEELLNIEFLYEKQNIISKEKKVEWLDKFYRRMSLAFYKWSIMPPSVMVEEHSINKCDYTQPITSSNINYKVVDDDHIFNAINS